MFRDEENKATAFIKNFQGSNRTGKTLRMDKTERFVFINNIDQKIYIFRANKHTFIDHVVIEHDLDEGIFIDFQPLSNMRLITLTSKGLFCVWRFNVFKKKSRVTHSFRIKRKTINGFLEKFESLVVCEREHYIAISTSVGKGRQRSRIMMFYMMDYQDYAYKVSELNFFSQAISENPEYGENGNGSAFIAIGFYNYVANFPVLYAQEYANTGSLFSFYFSDQDFKIFKPMRFRYHYAEVMQMVNAFGYLWTIDMRGKLNRLSLES